MSAVSKIRSLDKDYSMEGLYKEIGRSRQSYSQQLSQIRSKVLVEKEIISLVMKWREDHPKMGSRSLYYSMKEAGDTISVGINSFEQMLSRNNLTVGTAKRTSPHTSDGLGKKDYPNLANGLIISGINQLVVADITHFWIRDRWYYLFVLKDVYSQRLVSLVPSDNMKVENAMDNLNDLLQLRGKPALSNGIFHTDNGSQYEARVFRKKLVDLEMRISRSTTCKENGSCEQCNHIIKNMYLQHYGIGSFADLQLACTKVKYMMNNERAIEQLGRMTVKNFETALENIPIKQRPLKTLYDFN